MSKINDFVNKKSGKDMSRYEKMYGTYGCKHCSEDVDFAYWDVDEFKIVWICSSNHRSEHQLV